MVPFLSETRTEATVTGGASEIQSVPARSVHKQGGAAEIRGRIENAQPVGGAEAQLEDGEPDYVVIRRDVLVHKGEWRLPPEVIERAEEQGSST
jgi:hypothetical protein